MSQVLFDCSAPGTIQIIFPSQRNNFGCQDVYLEGILAAVVHPWLVPKFAKRSPSMEGTRGRYTRFQVGFLNGALDQQK